MKYTILLDGNVIHNIGVKGYQIYNPKVTLEQNKIGSFQFTIYSSNPYYSQINELKSNVKVYQNDDILFDGRVLEKTLNTNKSIDVYCESVEGYLCDSLYEPFTFSGSITAFLQSLLDSHNKQVDESKQYTLGEVSVTDPNDYIVRSSEDYNNTWNVIQDKLVNILGGYLVVRHVNNGLVLDYLDDFSTLNSQHVVFGKNMLSVKLNDDYTSIANVLIPLGAKDENTGARLTIESVNDGKKYLENTEAIAKYGRIVKYATWDDVTIATNLKNKGQAYLDTITNPSATIEITALDMATINQDISNFKMYSKIKVTSEYHGLDEYFTPLKMNIDLFNAKNNKITLNGEVENITGSSNSSEIAKIKQTINNVEGAVGLTNEQLEALSTSLKSEISQSVENVSSTISEKVELNSQIIEEQSTELTQTKSYFEMLFSEFNQELTDVVNGNNASFDDIKKYIRFVDGDIILGQVDNVFSLRISKDKISFLQGNQEVAYLSNSKLYITYANVLNSIQIGNFNFASRDNGSLGIKVVGVW